MEPIAEGFDHSVKFFVQKSPNVHKSMLLRGVVLAQPTLNEMDFEVMRRHASTHDRIQGLSWQNRDSPRNGTPQGNKSRPNGNSQGYSNYGNNQGYFNYGNSQGYSGNGNSGGQHMKGFPPSITPGIPPSNAQASQWYQQTASHGAAARGGHSSGVMRLEDLAAQFGGGGPPLRGLNGGDSRGGQPSRGYYNQDRRGGGSGYYQDNRYGSGYRDSRR